MALRVILCLARHTRHTARAPPRTSAHHQLPCDHECIRSKSGGIRAAAALDAMRAIADA